MWKRHELQSCFRHETHVGNFIFISHFKDEHRRNRVSNVHWLTNCHSSDFIQVQVGHHITNLKTSLRLSQVTSITQERPGRDKNGASSVLIKVCFCLTKSMLLPMLYHEIWPRNIYITYLTMSQERVGLKKILNRKNLKLKTLLVLLKLFSFILRLQYDSDRRIAGRTV